MPVSLRQIHAGDLWGFAVFGFLRWRFARRVRRNVLAVSTSAVAFCALGCGTLGARPGELTYIGEPREIEWYRDEETSIAHSNFCQPTPDDVAFAQEPRTIADRRDDAVREISLADAIYTALTNNKIIQTGVQAPVGGKAIFGNPDNIASVYDQAINETGVLFGRRSVEAALSDFDATVRTTMTWGRSRAPQNSIATLGATSIAETGEFTSSIRKQFATGASLSVFQTWDYLGSNSPAVLFPSSYSGRAGVSFRQPLLAGSGSEFTRVAGPVNPNFGAITGVSQGVLIARINSDISLTQFEASVRDSIRDVQRAYWDLYLAYRIYDTAVVAHRSAHQTWKETKIKLDVGTLKAADEAQALEQFYATQAAVEASLNTLYKAETALRRLMGMQLNDGEILLPSDSPPIAQFQPDWRSSLAEGLTRRVELRRQKWNVKSLQFQLRAAKSLVRPQLDFVSGATLNGFGDDLLDYDDADPISGRNLGSGYSTMLDGDYGSWNLGVEFSVPLGFRSAQSQVRNYELRVAKARAVLAQIEREIAHDVTTAIQDIVANYTSAETNRERLEAARRRVQLLEYERVEGTLTLDLVLRAQVTLARAESDYHSRIVDFTKAMIDFEYAKGSLLASSGVQLAEGGWDPCAYEDALRRAQARTYAFDNEYLQANPAPFASPTPLCPPAIGGPLERAIETDEPEYDPPPTPDAPDTAPAPPIDTAAPQKSELPDDSAIDGAVEVRAKYDIFDWDQSPRHAERLARSRRQMPRVRPASSKAENWRTVYQAEAEDSGSAAEATPAPVKPKSVKPEPTEVPPAPASREASGDAPPLEFGEFFEARRKS